MATVAGTLTALELADRLRVGEGRASPFEIWQHADREADGVRAARQTLYRHSMIHAGFLLTAKGDPYKRCPMCHSALKR
jgi:hypothetical protein